MTETPDLPTAPCPHPEKRRYATEAAAHLDEDRATLIRGWFRRPYQCGCGWWHLTSETRRTYQTPTDADGTPYSHDDLVRWLAALPEDHHQHIVGRDAAWEVSDAIAAALRDPRSIIRWLHTLKTLHQDTRQQLSHTPAGISGRRDRRALQTRLSLLTTRQDEGRTLLPPEPTVPTQTGPATPGTVSRYAAAALRRRLAAQAETQAVTWLIRLHPQDWEQLRDRARLTRGLPPVTVPTVLAGQDADVAETGREGPSGRAA